MQNSLCVLLAHSWSIGLIILLAGLACLVVLALVLLSCSPNPDATHDEIRRVGRQARGEIREAAENYQKQAEKILTKKR